MKSTENVLIQGEAWSIIEVFFWVSDEIDLALFVI